MAKEISHLDLPAASDVRIGAIVVFYNPDAQCYANANRLANYVDVVVVDNTDATVATSALTLDPRVHYIPSGRNEGVATALNRGVAYLREHGFDLAILFDQDSAPDENLLRELPRAMLNLMQQDARVALIGPVYVDERLGGMTPFVRFAPWRLHRIVPEGTVPVKVDFLISSGSCVNLRCWDVVGPLQDNLFIDFVDLEWCIRARRKGFNIYGIPWIHMKHSLGDEPIRILGRLYPSHSATRHYYLFRNAISLILRRDVPWSWKSGELVKLPVRLAIYALFLKPRLRHVKMAWMGILDGIRGRLGPLNPPPT
jgi:rhamnosyltransferase